MMAYQPITVRNNFIMINTISKFNTVMDWFVNILALQIGNLEQLPSTLYSHLVGDCYRDLIPKNTNHCHL